MQVYSDASGGWGCGTHHFLQWFSLQWPSELESASIQVKELIPVVIAGVLYGKNWTGKIVQFKVDNEAVVAILNNTYSRESHLMHLVRTLTFFAAHYGFWFTAEHVWGADNGLSQSCNNR